MFVLILFYTHRVQVQPTAEEKEHQQDMQGPPNDFRDIEIFPQTADIEVRSLFWGSVITNCR